MHQFCFNDCIPNTADEHSLGQCLMATLKEYNIVKKEYPNEVDGIVTSTEPYKFHLNPQLDYSLEKCIASMPDKDLRTTAYRVFAKYPVEEHFTDINEDDLLDNDYKITIAGTSHTAFNPVIVSKNGGVLFTLGLHPDLQKNTLSISSKANTTVEVNNLHGEEVNTTYIKDVIKQSVTDSLENFGKCLAIIGNNIYSTRFRKGFEGLSSQVQQSVLTYFEAAKQRNGATPFFADNNLVKDVTPAGNSFRVFELRIFEPVPFRVYFYEGQTKTYLAMIEKKPADKKQDGHIKASTSSIKQMLIMDK